MMKSPYRKDFPIFEEKVHGKPFVYLDSAATAQKPRAMIDAISNFYAKEYGTVNRAIYEKAKHATHLFHQTREAVQKWIHAKHSHEILFTRGTTESINMVARMIEEQVQEGDEILITDAEHHANIVPWQWLAKRKKAHLKILPVTDKGEISIADYEKALSDKTKLVSFAHVFNVLGSINPVEELVHLAKKRGILTLIDGAQAAAHLPIDVQKIDCDFYVFSAHKLYGPTGIGVLYIREALQNQLPPIQGGGDMIETVTFEETTFQPAPAKFEAGTPAIAEAVGLLATLNYLSQFDLRSIETYEEELTLDALDKLQTIQGVCLLGTPEKRGSLISFTIDHAHPLDVSTLLDFEGIALRSGHLCAQPIHHRFGVSASLRVSFGLYNDSSDTDQFIEALRSVLKKLS